MIDKPLSEVSALLAELLPSCFVLACLQQTASLECLLHHTTVLAKPDHAYMCGTMVSQEWERISLLVIT